MNLFATAVWLVAHSADWAIDKDRKAMPIIKQGMASLPCHGYDDLDAKVEVEKLAHKKALVAMAGCSSPEIVVAFVGYGHYHAQAVMNRED